MAEDINQVLSSIHKLLPIYPNRSETVISGNRRQDFWGNLKCIAPGECKVASKRSDPVPFRELLRGNSFCAVRGPFWTPAEVDQKPSQVLYVQGGGFFVRFIAAKQWAGFFGKRKYHTAFVLSGSQMP